jgi:hypothetical protein
MCVTSATAILNSTYVGAWEIDHPVYGYRHVMAYQNAPQNLAEGANCMLLHLPAAEPLLPEYLLDTADCPNLLKQMAASKTTREATLSLDVIPQQVYVVEMGIYHVVLLNEKTPEALEMALAQVPAEKRPQIAPELLQFYSTQFPDYPIVLACFNNRESKQASPIVLHFKPSDPSHLFFNLLEGHDGGPPQLNQLVERHQVIIAGSRLVEPRHGQFPVEFKPIGIPEALHPFLPTAIDVEYLSGEAFNDDGLWVLN